MGFNGQGSLSRRVVDELDPLLAHAADTMRVWRRMSHQVCERIGKGVTRAVLNEGQEICLEFDDGACLTISLRPDDDRAAEAVIFESGDQDSWVW